MIDQLLALLFHVAGLLFRRESIQFIPGLHEADHPRNARVSEAVKHMLASFVAFHNMRFFQDVQMLADGGEFLIGSGNKIADAELLSLQIFCNPETSGVSKCLEYLCKVLEIEPNALLPDENDSKNAPDAEGYISIRKEFINKNYKAVIEYDADDEFSDEICALKAKACLMVAREYSGSDSATDLQKAIDLAKQASELSKRGIFADESVKNKADELLKANAKRLSDYYRSLL